MLKKEAIDKIAKLAKIDPETLQKAITDAAEVDVPLTDDLETFTAEEVKTLKRNEYNNGKTAGVEMTVKEAKEKNGLDFTGKTIDGLLEHYGKKVLADAKIEPEKKVAELTEKLTTAQKTVSTLEQQIAEKDKEVKNVKVNGALSKLIPSFGENGPALGTDETISLMQANGYSWELDDSGALVMSKGGVVQRDKVGNPIPAEAVVTEFLKAKKLIGDGTPPAGRGGGTGGGGATKFTKLSELRAHYKSQGKSDMGAEFSAEVQALKQADPTFDLAS